MGWVERKTRYWGTNIYGPTETVFTFVRQERIEPAREHATTHVNYIDGEIQTWRPYSK